MFQKANDPVALAVDLVNTWDELEPDPELLRDAAALKRFLARHGYGGHRDSAVAIWRRSAPCETRYGPPSPPATKKPQCGSSTAFSPAVRRSRSSSEAARSGGSDGSDGFPTRSRRLRRCHCSRRSATTAGTASASARARRAAACSSTARRTGRGASAQTSAPTGSRRRSIESGAEPSGRPEPSGGRGYTRPPTGL